MFIHLHNHTDYSLLDGAAKIDNYVKKAETCGMPALAVTDHGNMYGALTFYNACNKKGIKPIIGCEFYLAPGNRSEKAVHKGETKYYHLILLAMDERGYRNLLKLNTIAWTEGFYYKPRIDHETLEKHNEGLICLSACIAGEIPRLILSGRKDEAMNRAAWYKGVFGDRFYLEIQRHGIEDEKKVNDVLINEISPALGIPLVCTNDIHYIEKEDWDAHDTLLCIGTKALKNDVDRLRYEKGEFYFRTEEEMRKLFSDVPEAVDNSGVIASRCNLEIQFPGPVLPKAPIPEQYESDAQWLEDIARKGLARRYPNATQEEFKSLESRLEHELDTIIKMGFASYFLIVQDYINWAKDHDISVGPGRGSGAGSLVAYSIGITDIDPIRFDLLFERFLNSERVSMPDFDVDFSDERRGEVIEYVLNRYGRDHVGQIATFGTLKAKAVVKDVARVLGISPTKANEITSIIPDAIPDKKEVYLADALEAEPMLKDYMRDPLYEKLFETAMKLEGMARHVSLHAAGVVIGREVLDEYVPLCMPDQNGRPATQYPMTQIEDCGLVKMDFLGLKTLTLIDHAVELIRKKNPDFNILNIPDNDEKTLNMLRKGDSSLVFQFESLGMQDILKRMVPQDINDLVALNALYRPGPMQFIDKFIEGRHHPESITYPDPSLEELLKPTYGVIVYQEQVMKAAQIIAGYSLGQADILRRIMGKKKKEALAAELVKFIDGAVAKGHSREHAEEIFHILEPFAGYGFNKSHAVAYTMISYRTAYLKAHYPVEFLAANLTNEIGNPDKFEEYLRLAKKTGIRLLPPSVDCSETGFTVEGDAIRYGLSGIRNMGDEPAALIVEERRRNGLYKDFCNFVKRSNPQILNTRVLEALICAGCFEGDKDAMLYNIGGLIAYEKKNREAYDVGQFSLFDTDYMFEEPISRKTREEWASLERTFLGCYISSNPLGGYPDEIANTREEENGQIRTLGVVIARQDRTTRKGERMAKITIETRKSVQECIVFPSRYECFPSDIRPGSVWIFRGRVKKDEQGYLFILDSAERPDTEESETI